MTERDLTIEELWDRRDRQELATLEAYQRHLDARRAAQEASEEHDRLKAELLELDHALRGRGERAPGWQPFYGSDERKAERVDRRIRELRDKLPALAET